MIRFVYPNVRHAPHGMREFFGCGRYLAAAPDDPRVRQGGVPAEPNVNLSQIHTAVALLAPEPANTDQEVFEYKDHPHVGTSGYSLGLAYLFALLTCKTATIWERAGQEHDIWCTGAIDMVGGQPIVKDLSKSEFDVKFQAFLQVPHDRLFIVPHANITLRHKKECASHHARLLSLTEFRQLPVEEHFACKTVLLLHGNELQSCVEYLFDLADFTPRDITKPKGMRLQNLRDFTVQIRHPDTHAVLGAGLVITPGGLILTCASILSAIPQNSSPNVDVYFPQIAEADSKVRQAVAAASLPDSDDDIVLLKLVDGDCPLTDEQIAVLGKAADSRGNPFETYGYAPHVDHAIRASGFITGGVETLRTRQQRCEPVQLQSGPVAQHLKGAAVLDTKRNLVVGIITALSSPLSFGEGPGAGSLTYAVNTSILAADAFEEYGLELHDAPHAKGYIATPAPQEPAIAAKQLAPAWNNASAALDTWIGRDDLLHGIFDDWQNPDCRVTGLIGFGGEGKSSLARKIAEDLLQEPKRRPAAVFWWGFYTKPNIDEFFEAALRYMSGGTIGSSKYLSASERAKVLGSMFSSGPYLFVLDGLEPLQYQNGDRYGLLTNDTLRAFLSYFFAEDSRSFCLITSRVPLLDLMGFSSYQHRDVTELSLEDGRTLLRSDGVQGDDKALEQVVTQWGGHALTLSLIATYLREQHHGDVQHVSEVPPPIADEPCYDRVNRILQRYDHSLSDAEQSFLMIFSLFRIPVEAEAFAGVFRRHESLASLQNRAFRLLVSRLTSYRLIQYDPGSDRYTAHPLITSHYRTRLDAMPREQPQTIHLRIKDYYLACAEEMPASPSLEELTPLFEALHHGCRAGDYAEMFTLFGERINQEKRFWLSRGLGAYDTHFALLLEFFPHRDYRQAPYLSDVDDLGILFNGVGTCLEMLGRLHDAASCYQRAIAKRIVQKKWAKVSLIYQNVTELYINLGQLRQGAEAAQQALHYAFQAEDSAEECFALANRAWMAHLQGHAALASATFTRAETLEQRLHPGSQYLQGILGIRHAEHLRRIGKQIIAQRMAASNLEICQQRGWKNYMGWNHRLLGDLAMTAADHEQARAHYDQALTVARQTGNCELLIESLLSRGRWAARHAQDVPAALSDLHEALESARQSGYRLYEADIHVALAWTHCAEAVPDYISSATRNTALAAAWKAAERARRMSEEMGYYWGQVDADEVMQALEEIEERC